MLALVLAWRQTCVGGNLWGKKKSFMPRVCGNHTPEWRRCAFGARFQAGFTPRRRRNASTLGLSFLNVLFMILSFHSRCIRTKVRWDESEVCCRCVVLLFTEKCQSRVMHESPSDHRPSLGFTHLFFSHPSYIVSEWRQFVTCKPNQRSTKSRGGRGERKWQLAGRSCEGDAWFIGFTTVCFFLW